MSDFPAVPLILDRKAPGHVQVVLGTLRGQIDFLKELLGRGVREVALEQLTDAPVLEALQGTQPTLFVLPRASGLSLAADTRAKVGVWTAAPLKPRTAAIRTLVRQAIVLVEAKELAPERIDVISDAILTSLGEDALPQALIWEAAWHLTDGDPGVAPSAWVHPWEDHLAWATCSAPLPVRLHSLHKDLCGYVFALDNDWKCAGALGLSPSKFAWLKTLRLNLGKVEAAIRVLSRWRTRSEDAEALQVALQISQIFAN